MRKQFIFLSFLKVVYDYSTKSYKLKASSGFALIELLVAVAVFGIISAFVLLAYNRVSGQLFLTTLAYEIALSFREAQSYGVSVHEFANQGQTATFDVGYGLHFDRGSLFTYALFADVGGTGGDGRISGLFGSAYNENGCLNTVECLSVSRLVKGNRIYKFCGVLSSGDGGRDVADSAKREECSMDSTPPSNPPPNITSLDVTFLRPNPDAIIKTDRTSPSGPSYKAARVYVISPTGEKRVIEVTTTGQISIK